MATEEDFCYSKITVIPQILSGMGVIPCMLNQNVTAPQFAVMSAVPNHESKRIKQLFHREEIPLS